MIVIRQILFLVLCCFVCLAFSKMKNEHVNDMWLVFPFQESEKNGVNKKIHEFFLDVHSYLDYCDYPLKKNNDSDRRHSCNNLCELLATQSCHITIGNVSKGNHRIFYHWGWTPYVKDMKNDHHYKSLKNYVIRSCDDDASCVDKFFDKFKDIKKKRDSHLQDQYAGLLGKNKFSLLSRRDQEQGNAFIAIAYIVHILGDYTTNQGNDKTQEFDSVVDDIKQSLIALAPERKAAINDFIAKLEKKAYSGSIGQFRASSSSELGENTLNFLKNNFTNFLYATKSENYLKKFESFNYKMK